MPANLFNLVTCKYFLSIIRRKENEDRYNIHVFNECTFYIYIYMNTLITFHRCVLQDSKLKRSAVQD
jgi:hypothetical protein